LEGKRKIVGYLSTLPLGDGYPVRLVGVINVSPESFYKRSVRTTRDDLIEEAFRQAREGADVLDIGAKSTAPYLNTNIPKSEELRRAVWAIKTLAESGPKIPLSVDTMSADVAEAAINVGASIVNDVSGLKGDPRMADVVREYGVSAILAAKPSKPVEKEEPLKTVIEALKESLNIAEKRGLELNRVVIDPAIGFIRPNNPPWYVWDSTILAGLQALRVLGRPILVGVSRKSFIGAITGKEKPEERLYGSLSATAIAVYNGAHAVRTHDVKETRDVVCVASFISSYKL
jgi:dihydropteroate synthase